MRARFLALAVLLAPSAPAQTLARVAEVTVVGAPSTDVPVFLDAHGGAYFVGLDGAGALRLWRTDGTAGGTTTVSGGVLPRNGRVVYRDRVYFTGASAPSDPEAALYRTTPDGRAVEPFGGATSVENLTAAGGALFFSAETDAAGREPYRGDDTEVGPLADVCPGPCSSDPAGFAAPAGGVVLFSATDGGAVYGRELWKAVAAGAEIAADVMPGPTSSDPGLPVSADGTTYLVADGRDADGDRVGRELFAFDGAAATLVVDHNPGTSWSGIRFFGDVASGSVWSVYATVDGRAGDTPHTLDDDGFAPIGGLPGGSTTATTCAPAAACAISEIWDGTLFFVAEPSFNRRRLFRTDGAAFAEVDRPAGVDRLSLPTRVGGGLVMQGCTEAEADCALYRIDAVDGTPQHLVDLPADATARALHPFGGGLLLQLDLDRFGTVSELWGYGFAGGTASADAPQAAPLTVAAFPSPTAGPVTIAYRLATPGTVRIAVLDALGREVAVVMDGHAAAGAHRATWDPAGLPAGVYHVRAEAGGSIATERLVRVR